MNTISTKTRRNEFTGEDFPIILIDDKELDEIIHDCRPDIHVDLVPTLLYWLGKEQERQLVWNRIELEANKKIVPILMCSEDIDLDCTRIVAQVFLENNIVIWEKIGQDLTGFGINYDLIGETVDWFPSLGPYYFDKKQYLNCISLFRAFNKYHAED
ncbi:MAG TPA: hypothetical protein VE978_13715 [Chitinophagales bacterium]|nr:hypothetical protein [Chitinophagales bacterium]